MAASTSSYDVIIAGVGGMGSAAACHVAGRGLRVLALERFSLGHELGSSHGLTRIIRLAYFEHPSYVPLLRRAFELWGDLEKSSGERLLHVTGGLDVGSEDGRVFQGSLRSCQEHSLRHEVLDADRLQTRAPAWRVPANVKAVWQPDAGFLIPERCIAVHAARAVARGADIRTEERVIEWHVSAAGVRVRTDRGSYDAGQVVIAAGAWATTMVPSLAPLLTPERQVLGWFEVADHARFAATAFPVFVFEADEGIFYGFPEHNVPGFKIGKYHHRSQRVDPDTADRTCHREDEAVLRAAVARYFPAANGRLLQSRVCLFTNTPDEHFIVDRDPVAPQVLIVSPCSGHGFKFCSVIGEIVADLVQTGRTQHDISLFRLARFA